MTQLIRWLRRLFHHTPGRKLGTKVVRTPHAACRYTPEEWALIRGASRKQVKRLAKQLGRTPNAVWQAWRKAQRGKEKAL